MRRRLLLAALLFSACTRSNEVQVFAAASLTDALREIGARYERETGQRIAFNFAASSVLARQIKAGAPADLFLSADEAKMNEVEPLERASVLSNTLVIVGEGIQEPRDLVGKRVALAEPSTVPAGIYARQYLTTIGLWQQIEPNVVPAENVRAALAAVESGNVDAAFVYKTDAKGRFAYEVPRAEGPRISYPFGLLREEKAARAFFEYLKSKPALDVFASHGFLLQ